jgi:hypothetical protein
MSRPRRSIPIQHLLALAALVLVLGTAPPRAACAQSLANGGDDPSLIATPTSPDSPLGDPTLPESPLKDRRSETSRTTHFNGAVTAPPPGVTVQGVPASWYQSLLTYMRNTLAHIRLR